VSLNVFKARFAVTHNTSAGKLFQVTGAVHENERVANSVFVLGTVSSRRAAERDWRVADKMFFFQVGWNTCHDNILRGHRRLVQDALTYWQPVELTKQQLGITAKTCWHNHTSCVVLHSLQFTDG